MRSGSVLIWHQTVVHGTSPNLGTNRCRMAQFLKAFDGELSISPERKKLRSDALMKALTENGVSLTDLTPEGIRLFGLEDYIDREEGRKIS